MDEITRFYHSSYLGLTVLALAALGLAGRRRFAWFLAALAGLAAILGAGPNLVVARGVGLQTAGNPLFLAFYYVWPGFRVMMEPLRFAWLAGFGACLLAAAGVARLAVGRCRHAIGGAVVALVAADLIWLSPVPFPYPATHLAAPRVYETIAAGPARQAVLELPVWIGETAMMPRERFYHQTLHRHPIADNISGHVAPYLLGNNLTRQLLKIGSPKRYAAFPDLSLEACRDGLDRLRADGFGWILLQQDQYEPAALTRTRALLDALLPAPLVAADGYVLYSLLNETKP
jgi:hypothetical protein